MNKTASAVYSLIGGAAFGLGMLVQRLIIGSDKIAHKAQREIEDEENKAREAVLDELEKKLKSTEGTKDEEALRDLRTLFGAFNKDYSWRKNLNITSTNDLLSTIDQIFAQCISSLDQTWNLYDLAKKAASDKIRKALLEKRKSIIQEVQESINHLNETLCAVQELNSSNNQEVKLSRLSQELNDQLAIAKRVKERMDDLGLNSYDIGEKTI